ncbi:sigma-E factor negative regulatory protein [Ideonella sp. YS5]|uniref:sigma-E factor negative regulatory protein n=1 Tax=Ideonella sp. YS5 TaxID=3453714 RepID=UPI003EEB5443
MTQPVDDPNDRRWLQLSALCDGEADDAEAQASFDAWRDEPAVRERWHAYQWIGDAMRSDDLASDAGHDQTFLLALRARLAQEPVVLAPVRQQPAAPAAGVALATAAVGGTRRLRWGMPAAMAAGVMVSGVLVMSSLTNPREAEVVTLPLAAAGPQPIAASAVGGGPAGTVEMGTMVRDPELDRYLNAHRQFVGSTSLAVPGGVRQVAVIQDGR